MSDWRPSATIDAIRARATALSEIRQFFSGRRVTEVEVPLLSPSAVTDPSIDLFEVATNSGRRFLQSSPEYAMKRLLAAGSGDIFYCGKAFRASEVGSRHNPEFTLLEWYRVGWDHHRLMAEVAALIEQLVGLNSWQIWTYQQLFEHCLSIEPLHCSTDELADSLASNGVEVVGDLSRRECLDLLLTHVIEPEIAMWGLVFVTDFPEEQAALARVYPAESGSTAARFEAYYGGVELANGYWEETDAAVLEARFQSDLEARRLQAATSMPIDEKLLAAHREGLPGCAGVAMGVDRLLMAMHDYRSISSSLSFDWTSA